MRKYECEMQEGAKDCGVASLLTIIKYYKGYLPKEYLRSITNTTNSGVNALSFQSGVWRQRELGGQTLNESFGEVFPLLHLGSCLF